MKPFWIEITSDAQSYESGKLGGKNKGLTVQSMKNRLAGKMIGIEFKATALLAVDRYGKPTFQLPEPIMGIGSKIGRGNLGPRDFFTPEYIPRKSTANTLVIMIKRPGKGSLGQGRHGITDPCLLVQFHRTTAQEIQSLGGLRKPSPVTIPITNDSQQTWHRGSLLLAIPSGFRFKYENKSSNEDHDIDCIMLADGKKYLESFQDADFEALAMLSEMPMDRDSSIRS